jgi:hypothetical protein
VHESLQLCAHLTALSRLQKLMLDCGGVAIRSDALQLAALTSLTQLSLCGAVGVDDVAASVLALRLTRLQHLQLENCGLHSAAALPSIATLTELTQLKLGADVDPDTARTYNLLPLGKADLLLLTPLTCLQHCCNHGFFCSKAVSQLWSHEKKWLQPPPAWLS